MGVHVAAPKMGGGGAGARTVKTGGMPVHDPPETRPSPPHMCYCVTVL